MMLPLVLDRDMEAGVAEEDTEVLEEERDMAVAALGDTGNGGGR